MKRGFTLIELLAVIVILAIISLIAVPIIVNIINDSKTSSDEQSVELYLDTVEKTITKKQLNDPNFNPDKCEIQYNGDLKCYKNNQLIDTLQVEMKGKMPNKGEITILNNKYIFKNILFNKKLYYKSYSNLVNDIGENGISIGDEYTYQVNDTDIFNFYVLSFNEDYTVNLIMNRNICGSASDDNSLINGTLATKENKCLIAWNGGAKDNTKGPYTLMKGLYNATKNWINIPNMELRYLDEGNNYGSIETINEILIKNKEGNVSTFSPHQGIISYEIGKPLKARLPMYSEVTADKVGCRSGSSRDYGSCPMWIVDNLNYSSLYPLNNNIVGINGYWLLSSFIGNTTDAYLVSDSGDIGYNDTSSWYAGIRPVITVPINDLSSKSS